MALNFPPSPSNGDYDSTGKWQFSSTPSPGVWKAVAASPVVAYPSPTAPASPKSGDLWYNTSNGLVYVYYTDQDTSQWVEIKANSSLGTTLGTRVDAIEPTATYKVADAAARNAKYGTPTQGNTVFRNDLGYSQTYYGLYNSSTNPGGKPAAGWYSGSDGGLVPIIPTSMSVGSGTGSYNADSGKITLSGASSFQVNGVFSPIYDHYRIILSQDSNSINYQLQFRFCTGGTPNVSGTSYTYTNWYQQAGAAGFGAASSTGANIGTLGYGQNFIMDVTNPNRPFWSYINYHSNYSHTVYQGQGTFNGLDVFDGIQFLNLTFTGTAMIYGYKK